MLFNLLYFGCVLRRVTLGSGRFVMVRLKIGYSSYWVEISSVSVEVRVKFQSVSGCHRLITGSILSGTDWFRVFSKLQFDLNFIRVKSVLAGSISISSMILVGYDLGRSLLGLGNLG